MIQLSRYHGSNAAVYIDVVHRQLLHGCDPVFFFSFTFFIDFAKFGVSVHGK